jgi:excisionase family DNA binding protein
VENPIIALPPRIFEQFVDAERAAQFLSISRKTLLALARKGGLPAYGVGEGKRKVWKFRLSELDSWMRSEVTSRSHRGRIERKAS